LGYEIEKAEWSLRDEVRHISKAEQEPHIEMNIINTNSPPQAANARDKDVARQFIYNVDAPYTPFRGQAEILPAHDTHIT